MEKICVLIPAYNEAQTIGKLVKKIKDSDFDVLVIDDGSTDATCKLSEEAGAVVIRHNSNRGKGASIREGIQYILSNGYDGIVIMDGDGQHDPAEIHRFLQKSKETSSLFIQGNRIRNPEAMPLIRFLTNKLMSIIISAVCRQRIADTQCGYKFIKREVLEKLNLAASRYDIESELLVEAAQQGIKIDSVPIRSIYRREKSEIKPFFDTLRFIRFLIRRTFRKA